MRIALLFLVTVYSLYAGVFAGVRYGQFVQDAKFNDINPKDKTVWGAGVVAGYEAENYRVLLGYDSPSHTKPAKSTIISASAQLIAEDTQGIKGFLGATYARATYTHSADPAEKENSFNLIGGDIGLILLDDRFPRTQMELGARYLVPSGLPRELDMEPMTHFYLGLNFTIY